MKRTQISRLILVLLVLVAACTARQAPQAQHPEPSSSAQPGASPTPQPEAGSESAAPAPNATPLLEYLEVLTGDAKAEDTLPMVIAVHGLGDKPPRLRRMFDDFHSPARIILPRGPTKYSSGFSWFRTVIRNGTVVEVDLEQTSESAKRIAELAYALAREKPTVGKPIITGFSQGGVLSFMVALFHPDCIAMAIPMSGMIRYRAWPDKGFEVPGKTRPKVIALHGKQDRLVPYGDAKGTVELMQRLGFDATIEGYDNVEHRISHEMRQRLFELLNQAIDLKAGSNGKSLPAAAAAGG